MEEKHLSYHQAGGGQQQLAKPSEEGAGPSVMGTEAWALGCLQEEPCPAFP